MNAANIENEQILAAGEKSDSEWPKPQCSAVCVRKKGPLCSAADCAEADGLSEAPQCV